MARVDRAHTRVEGQPLEPRVAVGERQAPVLVISNPCPKCVYEFGQPSLQCRSARFDATDGDGLRREVFLLPVIR